MRPKGGKKTRACLVNNVLAYDNHHLQKEYRNLYPVLHCIPASVEVSLSNITLTNHKSCKQNSVNESMVGSLAVDVGKLLSNLQTTCRPARNSIIRKNFPLKKNCLKIHLVMKASKLKQTQLNSTSTIYPSN